jgi:hypothetical protein
MATYSFLDGKRGQGGGSPQAPPAQQPGGPAKGGGGEADPSPAVLRPTDATANDLLRCLGQEGPAWAKTYEPLNGERFAWAIFRDTNQYQDSPRDGFVGHSEVVTSDRLTILRSGPVVTIATVGNVIGPYEYKRSGGIQAFGTQSFEKPLSPPYGRPFTVFQLFIEERERGNAGGAAERFAVRDPFDAIEPLPPQRASGNRITRVTVQGMRVDKKWYPPPKAGAVNLEQPKEIKEFFEGISKPWERGRQ